MSSVDGKMENDLSVQIVFNPTSSTGSKWKSSFCFLYKGHYFF